MVEIKSIAREPGARSKVAVASRESNLDPVGACVGPKGSRVRMVVEELRNERVDVIQWGADPRPTWPTPFPRRRSRVFPSTTRTTTRPSSFPTTSFRSPSARRAKTPVSRRV